jgi:hypothetical protein
MLSASNLGPEAFASVAANGTMAADGLLGRSALNCGTLASTRMSSANRAKVTAAVTVGRVGEVEGYDE